MRKIKRNLFLSKKRLNKIILTTCSVLGICSIIATPLSVILNKKLATNNTSDISSKIEDIKNNQSLENKLNPLDIYYTTPIITETTGPIISYGSKISALDWFGSVRWEFDFYKKGNEIYLPDNKTKGWPNWRNRAFINWSLDAQRHKLWILTNTTSGKQNILCLDSLTGNVLKSIPIDYSGADYNPWVNGMMLNISALKSGKVLIHWSASWDWGRTYTYDPKTDKFTFLDMVKNDKTNIYINQMSKDGNIKEIKFHSLIPIYENVNIGVFQCFKTGDVNSNACDLYLALLNDKLEKIETNTNSPFDSLIRIKNDIDVSTNSRAEEFADYYNKAYYTTIDGRVYWTAFNKFFVFYPDHNGDVVKVKDFNLNKNKRISSFTMDVNENVFFKYMDDTTIYKLIINGKKYEDTTFSVKTYYNLNDSPFKQIRDNAKNFILYNVTGYTGSIMLLNAKIHTDGKHLDETNDDDFIKKEFGLAAAIIPNINDSSSGDSQGLLNGINSFHKAADINIDNVTLKSKIPSEITKNDINVLNGGFFTENKEIDDKTQKLKYPPFEIKNIDDVNGSFEIIANIDQIPWFTNSLPLNSIPKKIHKTFNKSNTINQKVFWKTNDELSYDFKNTLPSKITNDDIINFDPFQISFNSNTILDSTGNTLYPKKTYWISNQNDDNGTIDINIKYEYIPTSVQYQSRNDIKTYESKKEYKVFSNKDTQEFYFAGSNQKATSQSLKEINIKNVPQLKAFSQANLLPSSFLNLNGKDFEEFVDTTKSKGYPLSKMNFTIEADDQNGKLTIKAIIEKNYSNKLDKDLMFVQTYSGFNKISTYNFMFNENMSTINNVPISKLLPNSINEGDIIKNFIKYEGFNSADFTINLTPNNDDGSLFVEIFLNKNYIKNLGNSFGFKDFRISKKYYGFMNTDQFNNEYNIEFKQNDDPSLFELKQHNLYEIYNNLVAINHGTTNGMNIAGVQYTNIKDLVQKLLIKKVGDGIIKNEWKNNNNILVQMRYDNWSGNMNLILTIKKEELKGYDSDINVIMKYSGFAKGNIVETQDNLSFIDNDILKTSLKEIGNNFDAQKFGNWLSLDPQNLMKIISSISGQYIELINSRNYTLKITTNSNYNSISITLLFDHLSNPNSLKSYSVQYVL